MQGAELEKCSHGANLLLNKNPKDAFQIATELDQFNKQRQMLEKNLFTENFNEINSSFNDPVIILNGKNWHEGVIGIVAARLKEKFNKPVIMIYLEGNFGKGSARSIVGFDIGSVIIAASQEKIILKGGGHKMAGGFSIKIENLEKFKQFIFRKFKNVNQDLTSEKPLFLDSVISPSAVNLEFYNKVAQLSPFGSGNPEPRFVIENVNTINGKIVGEKHVKSFLLVKMAQLLNL